MRLPPSRSPPPAADVGRARRIGDALLAAIDRDRSFKDGRVRNAYRAGALGDGAALLPGWWDAAARRWAEDAYQDGSATGNVAWAALALLTLHEATGKAADLAGAQRLLAWIADHTAGPNGFRGGRFGFDPQQSAIAWMSTEHNIDVAAVAAWLHRLTGEERFSDIAARARAFVTAAFDQKDGRFSIGTTPDGTMSAGPIVLDVQCGHGWRRRAPAGAEWRRALAFAEARLAVDGGFDFDADRDGLWVEGTAQAALAYRIAGRPQRGAALVAGLDADRSDSGLLNATRKDRITTGLTIEPEGTTADFFYFLPAAPRRHRLGGAGGDGLQSVHRPTCGAGQDRPPSASLDWATSHGYSC